MVDRKISVAVLGARGYTGLELLKLLRRHRYVRIDHLCSSSKEGKKVNGFIANSEGLPEYFSSTDPHALKDCDLVFIAMNNGFAMNCARTLLELGVKVVDLSADFRLKDKHQWEKWYHQKHNDPDLLKKAVYGLPEWNRAEIRKANLVANPGCTATAIVLALLPLVQEFNCKNIAIDVKSGVSGAGKTPNDRNQFCEVNESLMAYSVPGHRHAPEITQMLSSVTLKVPDITMIPMLAPMSRGIHASIFVYCDARITQKNLSDCYKKAYDNEPFVILAQDHLPSSTSRVAYSNQCLIDLIQPLDAGAIVIQSMIDNLGKGAAGQAVQNMNIMLGLDEMLSLKD